MIRAAQRRPAPSAHNNADHTFFLRPQDAGEIRDQEAAPAGPVPTGRLIDGNFAHFTVPEADGGTEAERRYIREGAAAVRDLDRRHPKGWVVDLRGNTGGSMYPMLTVLAPLLGHGHLGSFVDAAGEVSGRWLLRDGVVYVDDEALSATPHPYLPAEPEPPVAVLIDGRTMSAGEATLIAFLGMPRVRTFGAPTAGLATGNVAVDLADGAVLVLTVAREADRTGRLYGNAPIAPDRPTPGDADALTDAVAWLRSVGTPSPGGAGRRDEAVSRAGCCRSRGLRARTVPSGPPAGERPPALPGHPGIYACRTYLPVRKEPSMDAISVIRTKRDRGELTPDQIDWVIDAYTRGEVAHEQMSSLAMAIFLNGMNRTEIARWTAAMIASGERMDFSSLPRPTADKHSTGGVGDKITLPLAPLVAACGAAVPQLSGRGLGHTGGTLDKLEAIPGWRATLSNDEMLNVLRDVGSVICAAGDGLAPADKKLYALRDVTGTVESIPLIASSIMSKKIAEGTGSLVLDVKVGSGAFMKDLDNARELASTMVELGTDHGVKTVALLTDMATPLGLTAGNALEVRESVEVLAGGGPQDIVELTLALAREMLDAAGLKDADPAKALADGSAMDHWRRMISAQGGDPDAALPVAREQHVVTASSSGILTTLDAYAVGLAAWRLGAGRARKEDPVQAGAGVELHAKPGDTVTAGQPLLTLHTDTPEKFPYALEALDGGVLVGPEDAAFATTPVVLERIA